MGGVGREEEATVALEGAWLCHFLAVLPWQVLGFSESLFPLL